MCSPASVRFLKSFSDLAVAWEAEADRVQDEVLICASICSSNSRKRSLVLNAKLSLKKLLLVKDAKVPDVSREPDISNAQAAEVAARFVAIKVSLALPHHAHRAVAKAKHSKVPALHVKAEEEKLQKRVLR